MNIPDISIVRHDSRIAIVTVVSAEAPLTGCIYTVNVLEENGTKTSKVGWGHSAGWQGTGMSSRHTAMKNGRAAAKRYLKRTSSN